MSANNQTLVKEHEGLFYVFTNIQAESWSERNELSKSTADYVSNTRDGAYGFALELDEKEGSEYGVQFNRLCKDDAGVVIE